MGYPKGVADILPLTSAQRGMLFHTEGEAEMRGQYVAVISCSLDGALNPDRLRFAMEAVVEARDAFRTGFVWENVKQPVQVVREKVKLPWLELDWSDQANIEGRLVDLLRDEQLRRFDLSRPPLMAVTLIKTSGTSWRLVWTIHHLISDGWSTGVVIRELFRSLLG